jgi:hypothetical protein
MHHVPQGRMWTGTTMLFQPAWNPKECPLITTGTPQAFSFSANHNPPQDDQNLPPIADAITNKQRHAQASRAAAARNVSGRRRFVDPTTCDKDYKAAELEFMNAMQLYKQASGRMFPTWSEVLEVLKGIGYEKVGPGTARA